MDLSPNSSRIMPQSPARKSRRRKKPTKYTLDALDPLKDILSDTEESDAPARKRQANRDDEFDDDTLIEDDPFDESESGGFGAQSPSERSDVAKDDDVTDIAGDVVGHTSTSMREFARKIEALKADYEDKRTVLPYTGRLEGHLGISYYELRGGTREDFLKANYGPEESDIEKIIGLQVRWQTDPVLPQRTIDAEGTLGVAYTPWYSDEQRRTDMETAWSWLEEKEFPKNRQRIVSLVEEEAQIYLPHPVENPIFLLGPHTGQSLYTLGLREYMNFAQAWKQQDQESEQKGTREGWMINIGARIQTMGWAPNRLEKTQILALSAGTVDLEVPRETSVYVPNPGPSSIQLWEIASRQEPGVIGRLDMETTPRLLQVVCTGWGELKQLRWCPVSRNLPNNDLGLMATIWGDGKVRILNIGVANEKCSATAYVKLEEAVFTAHLPATMCTCVDWISSTTIAVGHSNGMLAVWDIAGNRGRLLVAHPIQKTYITAISTAYPSRPHLLASSTIEGTVQLTSLPTLQSAPSSRLAYGNSVLAWNDHLQAFYTYDNLYNIRMHPLRRFSNASNIIQTRSTILDVACSPCHPFILACGASGEVEATNPIRRFFDQHHRRLPAFQQTWFMHEWRPAPTQPEAENPTPSNSTKYKYLSRFQEGFSINIKHESRYKPVATTSSSMKLKSRAKAKKTISSNVEEGKNKNMYGIIPQTVYESKSAVTTAVWNGNLQCGGWVAAGIATGLLRIEDLCL